MDQIVNFVVNLVWDLWYVGIFIMMAIESSFIPFPSEIAMIPAWYLISLWKMTWIWVFLSWTFWAMTWATINYFLWFYLWAPIIKKLIHKYWKYIFLKEDHYLLAEKYFKKHWSVTTFLARFIPAVRQLISIPAGIFKMNFAKFFTYTFLWVAIWSIILIMIWYLAWENKDLISRYSNEALILVIMFVIIVAFSYYFINKKLSKSVG